MDIKEKAKEITSFIGTEIYNQTKNDLVRLSKDSNLSTKDKNNCIMLKNELEKIEKIYSSGKYKPVLKVNTSNIDFLKNELAIDIYIRPYINSFEMRWFDYSEVHENMIDIRLEKLKDLCSESNINPLIIIPNSRNLNNNGSISKNSYLIFADSGIIYYNYIDSYSIIFTHIKYNEILSIELKNGWFDSGNFIIQGYNRKISFAQTCHYSKDERELQLNIFNSFINFFKAK